MRITHTPDQLTIESRPYLVWGFVIACVLATAGIAIALTLNSGSFEAGYLIFGIPCILPVALCLISGDFVTTSLDKRRNVLSQVRRGVLGKREARYPLSAIQAIVLRNFTRKGYWLEVYLLDGKTLRLKPELDGYAVGQKLSELKAQMDDFLSSAHPETVPPTVQRKINKENIGVLKLIGAVLLALGGLQMVYGKFPDSLAGVCMALIGLAMLLPPDLFAKHKR